MGMFFSLNEAVKATYPTRKTLWHKDIMVAKILFKKFLPSEYRKNIKKQKPRPDQICWGTKKERPKPKVINVLIQSLRCQCSLGIFLLNICDCVITKEL